MNRVQDFCHSRLLPHPSYILNRRPGHAIQFPFPFYFFLPECPSGALSKCAACSPQRAAPSPLCMHFTFLCEAEGSFMSGSASEAGPSLPAWLWWQTVQPENGNSFLAEIFLWSRLRELVCWKEKGFSLMLEMAGKNDASRFRLTAAGLSQQWHVADCYSESECQSPANHHSSKGLRGS